MKHIGIAIALLFSALTLQAQTYTDTIYNQWIKSVVFQPTGQPLQMPIIKLNGPQRLQLSFDDLGDNELDYYYKIVHCDRNWQPTTSLQETDYLEGFNNELIQSYEPSRAIYTDYMHYELTLPNQFTGWTISGNYALIVYRDDADKTPIFTRRFIVSEQKATISHHLKRPIDALKVNSHIEMDFDVNLKELNVFDPLREVKLEVIQNTNWKTRRKGLIGRYMAGDLLKYNFADSITFPSLKEFRWFDIRPLTYTTENISTIDLTDEGADVYIFRDQSRLQRNYLTYDDANGQYVIGTVDGREADLYGDYAWVTFTLEYPEVLDGDIYIVGELSDWGLKEEYRMGYHPDTTYRNTVLLKQGYYNYMYAIKRNDGTVDYTGLEGSWHETENQYTAIVYYRRDEERFDRVIGTSNFNSNYKF